MSPAHSFEPKFAAEDLPYNRRGELSPRQTHEMHSDSRGCLVRLLIVNGIGLALILVTRAISLQLFDQVGVFGIGILFMGVPWLIIALLPTPKSLYDIRKVEGPAKVQMGYTSGQNKYYMLVVSGADFRISAGLYNALEDGPAVAVYYTTSGARNTIVSWELV